MLVILQSHRGIKCLDFTTELGYSLLVELPNVAHTKAVAVTRSLRLVRTAETHVPASVTVASDASATHTHTHSRMLVYSEFVYYYTNDLLINLADRVISRRYLVIVVLELGHSPRWIVGRRFVRQNRDAIVLL